MEVCAWRCIHDARACRGVCMQVMQTVHPQEDAWVAVWEGRACRCRQRKQQATRQGIKYKQRLRLPQGEAMPEANRLAITISKNRKAHCGKPLHTAKSP
eukprot:scaffold200145_cov19-Tisochrysis_lutea.AAC.1